MKTIGYIRVSSDKQDLQKQRHLLLEYANTYRLVVDEFIEVEISSRKQPTQRKIDQILFKLQKNDTLLVAELSRLGRNMLETLNIINKITDKGISIIFVRQPELSTIGSHTKLLLAIYSYFAESERDFISIRTKQGIAAAKANGVKFGRPKGSKNKVRALDPFRDDIIKYRKFGLSINAIYLLINNKNNLNIHYNTYKRFVNELKES